jgi:ribosomal protein S12 methylthiotransferase accessory factor
MTDFHYRLVHLRTEAATGFFDALPDPSIAFEAGLAQARSQPNNEFLRKHLLRLIADWQTEELKPRIAATPEEDPFLRALYLEACLLQPRFESLLKRFAPKEAKRLAGFSPLVTIKALQRKDQRLHSRWIELFRRNIRLHEPLPPPEAAGMSKPLDAPAIAQPLVTVERCFEQFAGDSFPTRCCRIPADLDALAGDALEKLRQAGVQVDEEMRHEASLSPIALLRSWQFQIAVACGRHRYRLSGEQISYGRGVELSAARAACVMEVVERVSSYASIASDHLQGYVREYALTHARASELHRRGLTYLDPNRLGLEAPYRDEPLYWLEGQTPTATGLDPILVPAQCVFLFCNLDESKLFSALGSNGLGAGTSLAQAKCQALLEIIERDSEATVPFSPKRLFEIESQDPKIMRLLEHYHQAGIAVGFVDITGPLGVPCCKSFVRHADGRIVTGTGAHLTAARAWLAALTETPYPFYGPPSQPLPPPAVRVPLEQLPDFDTGLPERNLALLEHLLAANGFQPVYVELTRRDLEFPVVRAIIPGMELMGDFDRFSRVHPRLYQNYLKDHGAT